MACWIGTPLAESSHEPLNPCFPSTRHSGRQSPRPQRERLAKWRPIGRFEQECRQRIKLRGYVKSSSQQASQEKRAAQKSPGCVGRRVLAGRRQRLAGSGCRCRVGQCCGNCASNCSGCRRIFGDPRCGLGVGLVPRRRGRRGKRTDAIRGDDLRGHGERERGRRHPRGCLRNRRAFGPWNCHERHGRTKLHEPCRVGPFERDAEVSGPPIYRFVGVGGVERRLDRPFCQRVCRSDGRRRSAIWRRHGPVEPDRHRRGCGGHGSRVGGNEIGRNCRSRVGGDRQRGRLRRPLARERRRDADGVGGAGRRQICERGWCGCGWRERNRRPGRRSRHAGPRPGANQSCTRRRFRCHRRHGFCAAGCKRSFDSCAGCRAGSLDGGRRHRCRRRRHRGLGDGSGVGGRDVNVGFSGTRGRCRFPCARRCQRPRRRSWRQRRQRCRGASAAHPGPGIRLWRFHPDCDAPRERARG